MTICVDFDGTCVTHEYPKIGKDIGAGPVLKYFSDNGNKIILYTMRDETLVSPTPSLFNMLHPSLTTIQEAVKWFNDRDIKLYSINSNPDQKSWTASLKPYAHVYIDDAALGAPLKTLNAFKRPFIDWVEVLQWFRKARYISEDVFYDLLREVQFEQDQLK